MTETPKLSKKNIQKDVLMFALFLLGGTILGYYLNKTFTLTTLTEELIATGIVMLLIIILMIHAKLTNTQTRLVPKQIIVLVAFEPLFSNEFSIGNIIVLIAFPIIGYWWFNKRLTMSLDEISNTRTAK